jgi:hypothetical protein
VFLIGAMKSGTRYLCGLLGEHPEIFMSTVKEPCYFVDQRVLQRVWPDRRRSAYTRSTAHYLRLFADAGDARVVMEASTPYSQVPLFAGVAEQILTFNPAARFIYIIRDPVRRTISHYWHRVRWWGERRGILQAIRSDPQYTDVSHYERQLKEYFQRGVRDRFYVLTYESLLADALNQLRRLYIWLGVDPGFRPATLGIPVNVTPSVVHKARGLGLLDQLRQTSVYEAAAPLVPATLRKLGSRIAARAMKPAEVSVDDVVSYLRPIQTCQTQALSELLTRGFPEWTTLWHCAVDDMGENALWLRAPTPVTDEMC